MNEDYKLSKIVRLALMKAPSQTIIINGAKQVVNQTYFVMCCPECGRAIYNFSPELDKLECVAMIMQNKEDLTKHFQYCPECGQKLNYEFDIFRGD